MQHFSNVEQGCESLGTGQVVSCQLTCTAQEWRWFCSLRTLQVRAAEDLRIVYVCSSNFPTSMVFSSLGCRGRGRCSVLWGYGGARIQFPTFACRRRGTSRREVSGVHLQQYNFPVLTEVSIRRCSQIRSCTSIVFPKF